MSSYQPQHQNPYTQQAPPTTDNSKTILIIIGVILGAIVLASLVCGGSVYYMVSTAKKKAIETRNKAQERYAQRPTSSNPFRSSQRPSTSVSPPSFNNDPKDLASAAIDLKNASRQSTALRWLKNQKFDSKHQRAICDGLMFVLGNNGSSSRRREAIALLETWGDKSIAKEIAVTLKNGSSVREKLVLLTRYKDPETAPMIAELFTNFGYAAESDRALRAIGSASAPHLIKYLSDPNPQIRMRASVLLAEFGVDVKKAEIEGLVLRLQSASDRDRGDVFNKLAVLQRNEEFQPTVAKAITSLLPIKDTFRGRDAIRALQVWGDKSAVPKVIEQYEASTHYREESIKFLMMHPDQRALPIMVKELEQGGTRGETAVQALISLGDKSVSATVPLVNSHNYQSRTNSRKVLTSIKGTESLVIKQCVKDLGHVEHRIGETAAQLLFEMEIIAKEQPAVADALVSFLLKHTNNRHAQPAFVRWAGKKQAQDLFLMLENRNEAVWLPAYKRLLELEEYKLFYNSTYKLLADWQRPKVGEYLKTSQNPDIESLMIRLAGAHTDENALVEICDVMATIGGKESVAALRKLKTAAQRERSTRVLSASSRAIELITTRMKKAESE